MKTRKVISSENLPFRPPTLLTLVLWLSLDKINAPGWAWGVVGTLVVILWIAFAIDVLNREEVDVINIKEQGK